MKEFSKPKFLGKALTPNEGMIYVYSVLLKYCQELRDTINELEEDRDILSKRIDSLEDYIETLEKD